MYCCLCLLAAYIGYKSRALGKGHGVKYGGVYSMEWEAIGNASGTWGNWEHQQINFANLVGTNWESYMQHIGHIKLQTICPPSPHTTIHPK